MSNPSIKTLSFVFDNKTDHILFLQIAEDGPLKRKHSGIKGNVGILEDTNAAAIRNVQESSGLVVSEAVLRGVVKTIQASTGSATQASTGSATQVSTGSATQVSTGSANVYLVYESSKFSGTLENKIPGRLKWVDILNIFNLQMESLVQEIMPNLLDGESFFEGTILVNELDEVQSSDIRICNTI